MYAYGYLTIDVFVEFSINGKYNDDATSVPVSVWHPAPKWKDRLISYYFCNYPKYIDRHF